MLKQWTGLPPQAKTRLRLPKLLKFLEKITIEVPMATLVTSTKLAMQMLLRGLENQEQSLQDSRQVPLSLQSLLQTIRLLGCR